MISCELVNSCPYFVGTAEMPERYREEYCRSQYQRCGRYMIWIATERERRSRFSLENTEGSGHPGQRARPQHSGEKPGGKKKMKPEECPKLDECHKVIMVLDKDLEEFQYAEAIRQICAVCTFGKTNRKSITSLER